MTADEVLAVLRSEATAALQRSDALTMISTGLALGGDPGVRLGLPRISDTEALRRPPPGFSSPMYGSGEGAPPPSGESEWWTPVRKGGNTMVPVQGEGLVRAGFTPGDCLIVFPTKRSPEDGETILARVGGEMVAGVVRKGDAGRVYLRPHSGGGPETEYQPGALEQIGIVVGIVSRYGVR